MTEDYAALKKKIPGFSLLAQSFFCPTILGMNPNDPTCTEADRAAIVRAATERARFLRWIAEKLLRTDDIHIRRAAARALLQLTEGK
jgi:hypothetical protein